MTNREAYNQYIRKLAEQQIAYMERMSDAELVECTHLRPYSVRIIGAKLAYFKAMTAGTPVGSASSITAWLAEEAPDSIPWSDMLRSSHHLHAQAEATQNG